MIAAKTEQSAVESALNYVQSLRLAIEKDNTVELARLLDATNDATGATWDLVYANLAMLDLDGKQYDSALMRINTLRSLADTAISSIGKASIDEINKANDEAKKAFEQEQKSLLEVLETQQQGLDDLLKYVMDMIRWEVQEQIDGLNDQIEQYREIVDLQKESLRLAKDKSDYDKTVADKVGDIAKLQSEIDQLSLDDSREAQAEKIKLEEELYGLQEDLSSYQSDHQLTVQEETLDNMAEAYADEKDREISILEESISSQQKIYEMAIERISTQWDTLYQDLINWNYEAGSSIESELTSAWDSASEAVQRYGSYLEAILQAQNEISMLKASIEASSGNSSSGSSSSSYDSSQSSGNGGSNTSNVIGNSNQYDNSGSKTKAEVYDIIKQMMANGDKWAATTDASIRAAMANKNEELSLSLMDKLNGRTVVRGDDGHWYLDYVGGSKLYDEYRKGTLFKYHTGGIVGETPTPKENEVLALLEKGEAVLTEGQLQNLEAMANWNDYMMSKFGAILDSSIIPSNHTGAIGNAVKDLKDSISQNAESVINNCLQFNLDVHVNGGTNIETARQVGQSVGDGAIARINDAASRRGVGSLIGSALRH